MTPIAVLRLLLDRRDARPAEAPWDEWVGALERNAVLVRVADRLQALGRPVPPRLTAAAVRARARADQAVQLMRQAAEACERHAIPHVFLKTLSLYPDVGGDVDLLVARASDADALIVGSMAAASQRLGVTHVLSASRVYRLPGPGGGLELDIHHGRVGLLGEHTELAAQLLQHRRRLSVAGSEWWVPTAEDALVLQGLDRLAGRRSFRIADVVSTIITLRGGVDWDAVRRTARDTGVLPGLSCYLRYVSQIHRDALGRDLALPPLGVPRVANWGRAEFHGGAFRFPAVRVGGELYARVFGSALARGRWGAAGRLLLLPLVAAAALWRRATRAAATGALQTAAVHRSRP